jgi:serine/threonine protein kinase
MGEVYEAVHKESGHRVALKLLSTELSWSEGQRVRFLREGTLAASINHPNSLYVYGTEEIDGIPVIAMELAPGGTIKKRIDAEGELPPAEAVDAVLQIANGLKAAESAGVLHRDIKPGNCFVDRDGSIKIGDFGLAISTSGPDTVHLTATGAFLGTPAFASPEQVRGDDLDVRSDIYSVGATLYYLLTGQSPFEGATGMRMMAAILEKRPVAPVSRKHAIPTGLAQVVQRCLEKDPSARPQSYEELMVSLEPFGSRAPNPAPLTTRFVAGLIDWIILAILSAPLAFLFEGEPQKSIPLAIAGIVLSMIYGGILEGVWGATPGKRLMQMRVLSIRGNIPGIPRAFLRASLFWSVYAFINAVGLLLAHTPLGGEVSALRNSLLYAPGAGIFVIFLGARRANGWSGIHDRFSKTRVVLRQRTIARARPVGDVTLAALADTGGQVGPYQVPRALQNARPGDVVLGLDPTLQRKVWILMESPEAPPLSEARRSLSRPGRLRWLNGRRAADESWDAFEAVAGSPLLDVVRNRQPWSTVRYWLHDLAEEARHLSREDLQSRPLSLDRVWISSDGNALLLDFPAPATSQKGRGETAEDSPSEEIPLGTFLWRVAASALSGRSRQDWDAEGPILGPLPLHAREMLRDLVDEPDRSPDEVAKKLSGHLRSRTSISSRRRLGQLALAASPALAFTFFSLLGVVAGWVFIERNNPDINLFRKSFRRLREIERVGGPYKPEVEAERQSLEIYMAGPLRHVPETDSISVFGQKIKAITWDGEREARLVQLLEEHPDPSDEELAQARETLEEFIAEISASGSLSNLGRDTGQVAVVVLVGLLAAMLPLHLLFGFAFRGGLSHKLLGFALVRGDGSEATRLRSLLRSLIAWAPLIFCVSVFLSRLSEPVAGTDGSGPRYWLGRFIESVTEGGPQTAAIVLFFAGVIWTIARPNRGLHDLVAGTHVVPK